MDAAESRVVYNQEKSWMSPSENVRRAAEMRGAAHAANGPGLPDYAAIASSFRQSTILDDVSGLAQIASSRYSPRLSAPQRPTFTGRLTALLLRLLEPLVWRLMNASNARNPFQTVYDALLYQQEQHAQLEQGLRAEIERLRERLESLEHGARGPELRD